jgi:hypothetical protein
MAQLRAMDGVTRVALSSSEKGEGATGGPKSNAPGSAIDDCRGASQRPQFNMVVFFRPSGQEVGNSGSADAAQQGSAVQGTTTNAQQAAGTPTTGQSTTPTTPTGTTK